MIQKEYILVHKEYGDHEELIKRLKKVELNGLKYIVYRPKLDSRNPENKIISHAKSEISASIVSSAKEISILRKHGFKGFLIGETFMRKKDPGKEVLKMINEIR